MFETRTSRRGDHVAKRVGAQQARAAERCSDGIAELQIADIADVATGFARLTVVAENWLRRLMSFDRRGAFERLTCINYIAGNAGCERITMLH